MGFFDKLKQGLAKTRDKIFDGLFGQDRITDEFYENLEDAMIMGDMGVATTAKLMEQLKEGVKKEKLKTCADTKELLIQLLVDIMQPNSQFLTAKKNIILIVGVNGVGKTTSIGKLANYYSQMHIKTLMAAGDTFRAAAAEQLTVWAERAKCPIIKHEEGADAAAVVFDAISAFRARDYDLLICDTAGRLHNKKNLMNELNKIKRVIDRELPNVPCEVLLVLDATTGQNALAQAKTFSETCGLTGIIITKLDGTAKGGIAVAVRDELGVPIRFVGVGEGIDDMQPFDAEEFARALLDTVG